MVSIRTLGATYDGNGTGSGQDGDTGGMRYENFVLKI